MCTKNVSYCEKGKKSGGWGGGQGGCELRSEAFVKIQKKKLFFLFIYFFFGGGGQVGGGEGGSPWGRGSQGGCECENSKKKYFFWGGGAWVGGGVGLGGVRVDGNREVKLV